MVDREINIEYVEGPKQWPFSRRNCCTLANSEKVKTEDSSTGTEELNRTFGNNCWHRSK